MPKGSNNRLNEKSANRNNGNRMFDSQNNNRGGYNVGDMDATDGFDEYGSDQEMYDYSESDPGQVQYEEPFIEGSTLRVTHTVQHGCGNDKNKCNIILGWTCDSVDVDDNTFQGNDETEHNGLRVQLRNGLNTGTSTDPGNIGNIQNTYNTNKNNDRGINESEEYYGYAQQRARNQGLFTADQKLQGTSQIYTRQNPGGTRRGLEVPEERDYFPWWYPSPWRPAVIWHHDLEECEREMAEKSEAVEAKSHCYPTNDQIDNEGNAKLNEIVNIRDKAACEAEGAVWEEHTWNIPKPICKQAEWSQVNNLGNVDNTEQGGLPRHHDWVLPTIDELEAAGCHVYDVANNVGLGTGVKKVRFVVRTRYNMSTTDYDPYNTDSNCNQNNNERIQSPVQQNPTVDVGFKMQGLRLALNTAQTGRVFQDRSHVMAIFSKPANQQNKKTLNVNVQGKRGNIVQTFPAVEYDFWPKIARIQKDECIAFGWTGSNTHNNGNPAGDGQAGDAGEGRGGSDRSNLIQLINKMESYPNPLDKTTNDIFEKANCHWTLSGEAVSSSGNDVEDKEAQLYLLSGGYYNSFANVEDKEQLDVLLDNVSASMRPITCCFEERGDFVLVSTRNNNFSNRDQKLEIIVS